MADTLREAKAGSEPVLQAFVRHLRRDYERGRRSFAPLLLAREREEPCEELRSLMACMAREGGHGNGSTLLLLAALGLMLSSLARLPYPLPEHASNLLDELEAAVGSARHERGRIGRHRRRTPSVGLQAQGLSLRGIADKFEVRGYRTPRGGRWTATQVSRVLNSGRL
jgi:hypothetical protein